MNYQAKITPTFADRQNKIITPPHEPLSNGEQWQKFPAAPLQLVKEDKEEPPKTEAAPLKIALVGTAPSSRGLAPFNDPSWKIWGCSPGNMGQLPRVDAWFELHANLMWPECQSYGIPYVEWLKKQSFPIYMQDNSLVPNAITFPKDQMVKEFGHYFFTSSFAWMMALAITMGVKELALFGIDMASKDEYILQRSGGHYFMTLAAGRGIKVSLPPESDLAQPPPLYGYAETTPFLRKILVRDKEIKDRLVPMREQFANLGRQIAYLEGASEDVDYVKSIWGGAAQFKPEGA